MMFFGKNKSSPAQPKRRSTLGILFNPEIGASIRPLGESASTFVKLVAMIFAMNGLFPKNHPALTDEPGAPRLTLSGILRTAWNGLSFTKEGLPKVILFFAVAGAMFFSVLAVLTMFMLLFVGHAHAQTTTGSGSTSFFTPPDQTNDLAQGWMDFLFKGKPLPNYLDQSGKAISQSPFVQMSLTSALGFYSDAMLICAGIILFYHLVAMVVETAHHGVPMGKRASQIWAPIRLVVAIGLLVPVGSSGLNSGQYIVIQMAEWGSGLASNVWKQFVIAIEGNSIKYAAAPAPYAGNTALGILLMEACRNSYNHQVDLAAISLGNPQTFEDENGVKPNDNSIPGPDNNYTIKYGNTSLESRDVCGSYTIHPEAVDSGQSAVTKQIDTAISQAQTSAFQSLQQAAQQAADTYMPQFYISPPGNNNAIKTDILTPIADAYQTTLDNSVKNALGNLSDASAATTSQWTSLGWLAAGAYFNNIADVQAEIDNAIKSSGPTVTYPKLANKVSAGEKGTSPDSIYNIVMHELYNFSTAVKKNSLEATTPQTSNDIMAQISANITKDLATMKDIFLGFTYKGEHVIDIALRFIDHVAALDGVWQPSNTVDTSPSSSPNPPLTLGIQFTDVNPLASIAHLGHANLNVAYNLIDYIVGIDVGTGIGALISNSRNGFLRGLGTTSYIAGRFITSFLGMITLIFFVAGFTLAFYVPLIPFITFFFGALTWVATLLEAILMVPLVALAHLNPEGDGLAGANAKQAYYFVFNIFLRPVLMVFGLVCGLLIFLSAVAFLNKLFLIAGAGTGAMGEPHAIVTRIIYSIFYVLLIYIAANNAFQLINSFPNNAMRWMGQQGLQGEKIGGPEHLGGLVPAVSGYAGQQLIQGVTGATQKGISGLKGHLDTTSSARAAKYNGKLDNVIQAAEARGQSVDQYVNDPANHADISHIMGKHTPMDKRGNFDPAKLLKDMRSR